MRKTAYLTICGVAVPREQLSRVRPLRFLETEQFREMLSTYAKLKPLANTKPKAFAKQCREFDFETIYPIMDEFLAAHDLSTLENLRSVIAAGEPETEAFARTLRDIFTTTVQAHVTEYDVLGNSPATYFICGVWANMRRGREFHPASNGITVTYDQPDAYGNQSVRYRNKDYELTLIFEAVQEYTKNLSWTAHRLLVYALMRGNRDAWRGNTASFTVNEYMEWAGLKSRDAAYRQMKKDIQSITNMKLAAESYKKYFESFCITHLATEAGIKKYTGEVHMTFAENVRHFLTRYYQLIPDWMGRLSENAYRMAFYLFYRARKAPLTEDGAFDVRVQDIIEYIGLPTKEEVKNRNYDEAIILPFNKAVEEIENVSGGVLKMSFEYDSINSLLAGRMTVGVDETVRDYNAMIEKSRTSKALETSKRNRKRAEERAAGAGED